MEQTQTIQLKDYQKKPVEFLKYNRGLIIYHSMGSGKTLTALYSVYQFKYPIIIIGSKSSKKAFVDNIIKANMDASRFNFYTYAKIKKILESNITIFKNTAVIIDEAHNLRNENMHNLYVASALIIAAKVLLLTGTPVVNYINDLAVLVNIVKGDDVLPTDKQLFDQMFYDSEKMILVNSSLLENKLKNTISYYKAEFDDNYPTSTSNYIEVEMSHDQLMEYIYYLKKVIYDDGLDGNIVDNVNIFDIDYGLLPSKKRNFFLNATRQLSNTIKNDPTSPKIIEICQKIISGPQPVVVYSNFLKNGIYTLAVLLEQHKISYKTITGHTSPDKLSMIVNNSNNGLYKVLLISSAGSESLDLKNTRQIHIMEPHWNESKINQVIGRAIRYKSHQMLEADQRIVDIYYWVSVFPKNKKIKNLSADQFLIKISKKKEDMWSKYHKIITSSSIENNYFASQSNQSNQSRLIKYPHPHPHPHPQSKYHRVIKNCINTQKNQSG